MALTKIGTDGVKDDAVTSDKVANAINSAIAANTAKDLTALSAANLTSGTIPDARFPATLPAASAANLTAVPAANITGTLPAISGANLTSLPLNRVNRNLIINGAMQVDQRGDYAAYDTNTIRQYGGPDRFHQYFYTGSEAARYTFKQGGASVSPVDKGFSNVAHIDVTTADTNIHQDHAIWTSQRIEAYNASHLKYGPSDAVSVTLSFWIKSNVTGTYSICYGHTNMDERYITTYSISVADTWEKKTITIPGDTRSGKTISPSNGYGLEIKWVWKYGSSRDATPNTWATQGNVYGASGVTAANIFSSTSNNLYLTGVQLEVGSTATEFEHRSFGQDLALCQRYCQKFDGLKINARMNGSTNSDGYWQFPTMRATPSFSSDVSAGKSMEYGSTGRTVANVYGGGTSPESAYTRFNISGSGTSGHASYNSLSTGSYYLLEAEL